MLPQARMCVYVSVQCLISVISDEIQHRSTQTATENTVGAKYCWRLLCAREKEDILLPREGFLPLTSSLETRAFMLGTLGSGRGS